ncbi:hypothetical protein FIM10_04060 [Sphingomonadales bacterium 56]|nr:hypothetical protein [Sphingomonadales bacterium 56]
MAKAPRGASRRTAAASTSSAAPAAAASPAQAAPIEEASTPLAGIGHNGGPPLDDETPPAPPVPALEPAEAKTPAAAPAKSGEIRWLRMITGISGPAISLAPGDKHPFCDVPGDDDAPSEAQRLVNAGFAVDCDPPVEG